MASIALESGHESDTLGRLRSGELCSRRHLPGGAGCRIDWGGGACGDSACFAGWASTDGWGVSVGGEYFGVVRKRASLKLVGGRLLVVQRSGRHRYYSLAGAQVAQAIEGLGAIATQPGLRPAQARASGSSQRSGNAEIYVARSCYDHLAGRVAVGLAQGLEQRGVIRVCGEREYALGRGGARWFGALGVDVEALRVSRRSFARRCLDWTERRPHLAGALGAALFSRMLDLGWIARRRDSRVVRVTHLGERELGKIVSGQCVVNGRPLRSQ